MRQTKAANHLAFPGFVNEVGYMLQPRIGLKAEALCHNSSHTRKKGEEALGPSSQQVYRICLTQ
jgi:hypothetical protein